MIKYIFGALWLTMLAGFSAEKPLTRADLAQAVLAGYAKFSPAEKQAAVSGLASQVASAKLLLEAVAARQIPRTDLSSFVARQIMDLNDESLKQLLEACWGRIRTEAPGAAEAAAEAAKWKATLTPAFMKPAKAAEGRALFKAVCGTCHTLFGEGGKIGPDLTGSNRADLGYILENVTNPNAVLGRDYELHILKLKDGRVVAGMVRQESDSALTLQTMTNQEVVAKADIVSHEEPGTSMMPPGLLTALEQTQVRDLMAYLASPSQVSLPIDPKLDPAAAVPGVLEGEGMKVVRFTGTAVPQDMRHFTDGRWSGGKHLWWTGGKPGDKLELSFPVKETGDYHLQLVLTRAPDYAVVKLWLDGQALSEDQVDLFGSNVSNTELSFGPRTLKSGSHQLVVEITGANPSAVKGFMVGLDYLKLVGAK